MSRKFERERDLFIEGGETLVHTFSPSPLESSVSRHRSDFDLFVTVVMTVNTKAAINITGERAYNHKCCKNFN